MVYSKEEVNEILAQLRVLNEKILPPTIELDTHVYNELNLTSIQFINLIIDIQSKFDLGFEEFASQLSQVSTVQDIVEIILSLKCKP